MQKKITRMKGWGLMRIGMEAVGAETKGFYKDRYWIFSTEETAFAAIKNIEEAIVKPIPVTISYSLPKKRLKK